jgi:hypothetical protein
MFREAYPVNHFLLIAIYCTATLALAQSRGGLMHDVVAVACFALAALTLESGIVVMPLAGVGYLAGLRGISRRALVTMAVLTAGYFFLRVEYLDMVGNDLGDRSTGYGMSMLDGEAIRARFAGRPTVLYAYTIASSIVTVLLSQPVNGTWTSARAWLAGTFSPADAIAIGTSVATTLLIAWHLNGRDEAGRRRVWRPLPLMALTVLVGSAGISYAYAKSEIMSAAGVFYALLSYEASRRVSSSVVRSGAPFAALVVAAILLSSTWTIRAMGLQYHLERAAFATRNDWVHDREYELGAHTSTALASSLKQQALRRARTNPTLLAPELARLWGEE